MLWQTHSRLLIYSLQHISSLNFLFLARALAEVYARSYALVFWNVEFSPILQKDSCFDVLTWRNESHGKVGVDYKLGAARDFKSSTFAPRYSSPVCVFFCICMLVHLLIVSQATFIFKNSSYPYSCKQWTRSIW